MSRSHAHPSRTQGQWDDVDSRRSGDVPEALHAVSNEMKALRLINQRLLRELAELNRWVQRPHDNNIPMEAATPYHRRSNNTSVPLETMTEEEKIAGPEGMIPTYLPKTIETKECLTRTMGVKSRPLVREEKRNDLRSGSSRISNKSSAT